MKRHFRMFAHYNRWANEQLFAAVAQLSPAAVAAPRGAAFGSVLGTLNHILVGDLAWLHRLTGNGPRPAALDACLYDTLPALQAARAAEDMRLITVIDELSEGDLGTAVDYTTFDGTPYTQPLSEILAHLFNHQTHHRGQVHTLLTQAGVVAPALDLAYFLRSPAAHTLDAY